MVHQAERHRKVFGQHFLINTKVIDEIIDTSMTLVRELDCKTLLEIGPGQGALTFPFLKVLDEDGPNYICVEKDNNLYSDLVPHFQGEKRKLHCADFLQLSESEWNSNPPVFICSNLPYSMGTAILTELCNHWEKIAGLTLMFQKEVAGRIRAEENSSERGSLSLFIQNLYDVKKLIEVSEHSFRPRPKVKSEVLVFKRRQAPKIPNDRIWQRLIHLAFYRRRKMLRGNFSADPLFSEALKKSGIDPTLRAQHLVWEQWSKLHEIASQG